MKDKGYASLLLNEVTIMGFSPLLPAERRLLRGYIQQHKSAVPDLADAGAGLDDQKEWGKEREVRSDLIRMLCMNKVALSVADPRGINLSGAKITGTLDLAALKIPFPLTLQYCSFEKAPLLFDAEVPGLVLDRCSAPGMNASHIKIAGHLSLQNFSSSGLEISLQNSRIYGNLDCSAGTFSNPDRLMDKGAVDETSGLAISADGAVIDGYVLLRDGFKAEGEVRFLGAQIGGDIDLGRGSSIKHAPNSAFKGRGVSFNAERAIIKGSVFLRSGFESLGEARLVDTQISGNLSCEGGRFENHGESGADDNAPALTIDRASVRGTAYFSADDASQGFQVIGKLSLQDTRVLGIIEMQEARLKSATVDFSGATTAGLSDAGERSWPGTDRLYLRRFVYDAIVAGTEDADDRLKWLALQPDIDFNTDSYAQLAKVLAQAGDDDGARLVQKRLAELLRKRGHPYWYLSPITGFEAAIGYGYYPIFSIEYSLTLGVVGWIVYRRSYLAGTLVPTDKDAYDEMHAKGEPPPYYPRHSSLMMSVENSLPLVKLGQSDKWQPDPGAQSVALPAPQTATIPPKKYSRTDLFRPLRSLIHRAGVETGLRPGPTGRSIDTPLSRKGTSRRFVQWFIWLQILLGWLFATLFVAGVSGLIKR
jgi:hypothetical protein